MKMKIQCQAYTKRKISHSPSERTDELKDTFPRDVTTDNLEALKTSDVPDSSTDANANMVQETTEEIQAILGKREYFRQ